MKRSATPGQIALALAIAAFLFAFLVLPVGTVIGVAFTEKGTGEFTLVNFADFLRTELFVRSFWNSVYVSGMAVVWASVIALPLAVLTTRFDFRGAVLIQTLGFLPLIMPPFVGAVALQMFFGRNGSVNLLLDEHFGIRIPFMEGLNGVVFVQALHYFPFILINLSAALRNIDRAMEEAAQNLGCSGLRLMRRIVLPLAMPGYVAGASLVFVKVFDDLATPLLLSFATVWSFAPLPDAYTMAHYARVFGESSVYIRNTLLYATLAGLIDVVLGVAIAYLALRTRLVGRQWLDWAATAALAIPGLVLGIGYLRTYYGVSLPDGTSLATFWAMIVVALAVRRLPYALRACHAALQQVAVALEEAAQNLGATPARTVRRVVVPLMAGGILAGFVTSFSTAAVELSATLMLVQSDSDAPLAYGLYVFMQSPAGRGAGAALGVIAVVLVALCTWVSHLVLERSQRSKGAV